MFYQFDINLGENDECVIHQSSSCRIPKSLKICPVLLERPAKRFSDISPPFMALEGESTKANNCHQSMIRSGIQS